MKSQFATGSTNRIGFFLPLVLTFLVAADAAYACPQQSGSAGYRTKKVAARSASYTPSTMVITYRAPISYRRCGDTLVDTRGARYVARRGDVYRSNASYTAARGGGTYYRTRGTRYVAVRDVDRYEAPRYVAVRRKPVYIKSGTRYVAVRTGSGERLVPASEIADHYDDDITYVQMRRPAAVRYVAVRDYVPRTRYVRVRDAEPGCARAVALRSCPGDVGTVSTRRVVLRDDDDVRYSTGTEYVGVRTDIDDDVDDYVTARTDVIDDDDDVLVDAPAAAVIGTKYIDDDDAYLTASEVESAYVRPTAVRTYPVTYNTRTVSFAPVSYFNDDVDDMAYLDGGGATYVADGDIGDACLRSTAVYEEPVAVTTRDVRYVPFDDDVDAYAFHGGSAETYIEVRQPIAAPVAYMPVEQDEAYIDADAGYIGSESAAYMEPRNVRYVAVEEPVYAQREAVSYVAVDDVADIDAAPVSYVPEQSVQYVDAADLGGYDCAEAVGYVEPEPVVLVEETDSVALLGLSPTVHRIARTLGYNEGYEDGLDDAQDGDDYEPSDGGAQGYKRYYGDKAVYRGVYRSAYLEGYQTGYRALDAAL